MNEAGAGEGVDPPLSDTPMNEYALAPWRQHRIESRKGGSGGGVQHCGVHGLGTCLPVERTRRGVPLIIREGFVPQPRSPGCIRGVLVVEEGGHGFF